MIGTDDDAADLPAHLEAVHTGEHQVQDEQIGVAVQRQLEPGGPVGCLENVVPVAREIPSQHFSDGVVVVDHQDARANSHCLTSRSPVAREAWHTDGADGGRLLDGRRRRPPVTGSPVYFPEP